MKIIATSDLGALGHKESKACEFDWAWVNPVPKLIPWALLVALFTLKINRPTHARFLLIPLVLTLGMAWTFGMMMTLSSDRAVFVGQLFIAMLMGIGYLWLLSPMACSPWRIYAWLRAFVIMAGGACLCFGASSSFQFVPNETTAMLITLASFSAIATLSMSLAGFCCRKPHGFLRYPIFLLGSVLLTSVLCMVIIMFASGNGLGYWEFVLAAGMMTLMVVLFLLPYLILSATCAFYRERFRALVGMPTAEDLLSLLPPPLPKDIPAGNTVPAEVDAPGK